MAEKLANIEEIGGPNSHSNFPHGWAMASNTPLRRYKQNTHGGGIRDPLVISWKNGSDRPRRDPAAVRPCERLHAHLLDLLGIEGRQGYSRRAADAGRRASASHPR